MRTGDLQELMSRLVEDPDFRSELRADPEGALSRRGIQLSDQQRAELRELDLDASDERLPERVSKLVRNWSDARLKRRIRPI